MRDDVYGRTGGFPQPGASPRDNLGRPFRFREPAARLRVSHEAHHHPGEGLCFGLRHPQEATSMI